MKRIITAMLAALVAASMTGTAFAAYGPTEQVEDLGYAYTEDDVENQIVDLGDVFADDEVTREIPLVYALFDADPPEGKDWNDTLSAEDLTDVGVKMSAVKGGELVSPGVDEENGRILLTFGEEFDGEDDADFEVTIYLTVGDERYQDMGLTFTGTVIAGGNAEPTDKTDPPKPDNSTKPASGNPDTGDTSFMAIALAAMGLSVLVIGGIALRKRSK